MEETILFTSDMHVDIYQLQMAILVESTPDSFIPEVDPRVSETHAMGGNAAAHAYLTMTACLQQNLASPSSKGSFTLSLT